MCLEDQNPFCHATVTGNQQKEQDPPRLATVASNQREETRPTRRKLRCHPHANRNNSLAPPARPRPRHNYISSLYTSAPQFRGPTPSPTPDRPPERRGAGGIAAGSLPRLSGALFSPLYCSQADKSEKPSFVFDQAGR